MLDDWLKEQIAKEKAEREEQRTETRGAEFAAEAAPHVFTDLLHTVKALVARYRARGGKHYLDFEDTYPARFKVIQPQYPAITLEVELDGTKIGYSYTKQRSDSTPRESSGRQYVGIVADLAGNVQLKQGQLQLENIYELATLLAQPVIEYE